MILRRLLFTALVAGLLAGAGAPLRAQNNPPASPDKARLDDAFTVLATYDLGGKQDPLAPIVDAVLACKNKPAERKELAGRLAAILGTGAPRGAKDFACRWLSVIAGPENVPAIEPLLADEKLSHMARYVLERMPDAAAGQALCRALVKLNGNLRIGMISSLGARQETAAVPALAKLLADPDDLTARSAARALGKIGGQEAANALTQALGKRATLTAAVADGCLRCADTLLAQGKGADAVALYDRVRAADVPQASKLAATRGAIVARGPAGVPLLLEQLRGDQPAFQALALLLARELPGAEVTRALAGDLAKLPADHQPALIEALADRGDAAAEPAVLAAAKGADPAVRKSALRALAAVGTAGAIPTLVAALTDADGEAADAALGSLVALPGKGVDAPLLDALGKADAKARPALMKALSQRHVVAATPVFFKLAGDADQPTRLAAIEALGGTAQLADLSALADLLAHPKGGKELAAAETAFTAACARMPDPDACAEKLIGNLPQATVDAKCSILNVLGQVGGAKALAAVRAALPDANQEVHAAALDALANWQSIDAAADLAAVARTTAEAKERVLALRGYARLVNEADMPPAQKLAMVKEGMPLAQRDDEKKTLLSALGSVRSPEGLAEALTYLENPALAKEAGAACISIANRIWQGNKPATAEAMNRVIKAVEDKGIRQRAQDLLDRIEGKMK